MNPVGSTTVKLLTTRIVGREVDVTKKCVILVIIHRIRLDLRRAQDGLLCRGKSVVDLRDKAALRQRWHADLRLGNIAQVVRRTVLRVIIISPVSFNASTFVPLRLRRKVRAANAAAWVRRSVVGSSLLLVKSA